MDKLIIDCMTKETKIVPLTSEEIAQIEYEASLPQPIQKPTAEERLSALEEVLMMLV